MEELTGYKGAKKSKILDWFDRKSLNNIACESNQFSKDNGNINDNAISLKEKMTTAKEEHIWYIISAFVISLISPFLYISKPNGFWVYLTMGISSFILVFINMKKTCSMDITKEKSRLCKVTNILCACLFLVSIILRAMYSHFDILISAYKILNICANVFFAIGLLVCNKLVNLQYERKRIKSAILISWAIALIMKSIYYLIFCINSNQIVFLDFLSVPVTWLILANLLTFKESKNKVKVSILMSFCLTLIFTAPLMINDKIWGFTLLFYLFSIITIVMLMAYFKNKINNIKNNIASAVCVIILSVFYIAFLTMPNNTQVILFDPHLINSVCFVSAWAVIGYRWGLNRGKKKGIEDLHKEAMKIFSVLYIVTVIMMPKAINIFVPGYMDLASYYFFLAIMFVVPFFITLNFYKLIEESDFSK